MSTERVTAADATTRIKALAEELSRRGFITTVAANELRHPCVRVVSRQISRMREDVYAAPEGNEEWFFWWSWAEKIGPVADVGGAAAAITYVLDPTANSPVSA